MKELVFLGDKVSHRDVEADTQKIAPIIDMPNPTNEKELQRFLRMINYLGKFIPNLSNETCPSPHDDDWHPVAFASRSLQSSERNYS